MASIKVKFRPSAIDGHKGTIYYQIIHNRKVRQLLSDYKVLQTEWDESRSTVRLDHLNGKNSDLPAIHEHIRSDMRRLTRIIRRLDSLGLGYTADDILAEFKRQGREYTLFNYMEKIIARLRHNGNIRTSETYRTALNSFRKFLASQTPKVDNSNGEDIMLDSITPELIEAYEAWHKQRGSTPNTISFYARILRAVYNRAVENDIIENRKPFRHVYTGVDKTMKRALPLTVIKKIKMLDLSMYPGLDFARNMFMMSFYLRGMSFIDMAFLKKTALRNGYITYRRHKTGQQLMIKWTNEMRIILDKYPENTSDYLLPIIRKPNTSERCTYRNAGYNINRNLKKIAAMAGVTIPLTLYVARHSWASAAKAKGIPLSVISEGMGHDSEATTMIYLSRLDTSVVDKANSIILSSL